MKTITGNILDVKKGFIFHCTNCQNAMGKGVARALYEKWPQVKTQYHEFNKGKDPLDLLGKMDIVKVGPELFVVNVYGQLTYAPPGNVRHVDYHALIAAFTVFNTTIELESETFYEYGAFFPYLMGCALAGGDWNIVSRIIEREFPEATIIKLP